MQLSLRKIAGFTGLILVLFVIALLIGYGEVEPCRLLAVEKARRAAATLPDTEAQGLETWTRVETSQMTAAACMSAVLDSWGSRLDR